MKYFDSKVCWGERRMSSDECEYLPIVLVSAADGAAADAIISELIDNELETDGQDGRIWELRNKYYTARVRVRSAVDNDSTHTIQPEAHVIYLAENECTGSVLSRRAGALGVGAEDCEVRLALCARAPVDLPTDLRDAALLHGYELVSLSEASEPAEEGPFPELRGLERAREALHAHTWPSLRMRRETSHDTRRAPATQPPHDDFSPFQSYQNGVHTSDTPSSDDDVSRAEIFADALAAVGGVREAAEGAARGERVARAEQLVAAFARAMGTDIDEL